MKGKTRKVILNSREVSRVSAYLVEGDLDTSPVALRENISGAFIGSYLHGMGFTFDDTGKVGVVTPLAEMRKLIESNPANQARIRPYIGGEEVNTEPTHGHRRFVIDCSGLTEGEAREGWPDLMRIIEDKVRPERAHVNNPRVARLWWRWEYEATELYEAIRKLDYVLALARVSTHYAVARLDARLVYSEQLVIFLFSNFSPFATLQSRGHELWARLIASSMKDDLRYTPNDCFETFPFAFDISTHEKLELIGRSYHDHRAALMVSRNEGLTDIYNRFHDRRETSPDIVRLRDLHAEMDEAALRSYGWADLAERAEPGFLDETNEDDHKYQGRLFWPAEFREEVLARLLALNAERAAAERENEPPIPRPRAKRATKGLAEAELLESAAANEDD